MPRVVAIVALLLVATLSQADTVDDALRTLDALHTHRVAAQWDAERLERVLADLAAESPVPIAADWDSLVASSIDPDDRVTLDAKRLALDQVLTAIAMQLGDGYDRPVFEYESGRMVLMGKEAAGRTGLTAVYDIRDLLGDAKLIERLEAEQPPNVYEERPTDQTEPDVDDEPMLGGVEDDDFEPIEPTPGRRLLELIAYHIDPDAWVEYGGSQAKISERNGVMMVTAPPSTHKRFRDALSQLRRALPAALNLSVSVVEIDRTIVEQQVRQHGMMSSAARAINTHADGTVRWRTTSAVSIGQRAELAASVDDTGVSMMLAPDRAAADDVLSLRVKAVFESGADRRQVDTTIALPTSTAAVIVEMPSLHPESDTGWFIIIHQ